MLNSVSTFYILQTMKTIKLLKTNISQRTTQPSQYKVSHGRLMNVALLNYKAFISFYTQNFPPHVKVASKRRSCVAVVFSLRLSLFIDLFRIQQPKPLHVSKPQIKLYHSIEIIPNSSLWKEQLKSVFLNPGLVKDETSYTKINLWYLCKCFSAADGFQPIYQTQNNRNRRAL